MQKVHYFSQEELARFFNSIKKSGRKYWLRDLCIFRVAYRCGLRASEVGLISTADYNPQRKELFCKRLKNSQSNTIRLDDETARYLRRYIRENGKESSQVLFTSQGGGPISRQMLDLLMRSYCHKAGLADVSRHHFHSLKHSIAVHLAESGLDLKELQHYLGHRSVQSTLIYFQFTTSQQEEMYRKLEKSGTLV